MENNGDDQDLLQELLSLRRSSQTSSWDSTTSTATFSNQMIHSNALNNNVWSTTTPSSFTDNTNNNTSSFTIMSSSSSSWAPSIDPQINFSTNHLSNFNQVFHTPTTFSSDQQHHHPHFVDSSVMEDETASFLAQQDDFFSDPFSGFDDQQHQALNSCMMDDEDHAMMMMLLHNDHNQSPKMEQAIIGASEMMIPSMFNVGSVGSDFLERKSGKASKKVQGQPSKNLMAERRRRKRLNDRLSMLRSIVPKISKLDRTSIVGDTIDYMKELLERIHRLQEELGVDESSNDQVQLLDLFKDVKPNNEVQIRNTPKFEVERRNVNDTRIEIRCSGKPGLLLSTLNTMEALGLEIEQCVISCFNEFEMNASCSDQDDDRSNKIKCEEIKEAMFKNAGYGGSCL